MPTGWISCKRQLNLYDPEAWQKGCCSIRPMRLSTNLSSQWLLCMTVASHFRPPSVFRYTIYCFRTWKKHQTGRHYRQTRRWKLLWSGFSASKMKASIPHGSKDSSSFCLGKITGSWSGSILFSRPSYWLVRKIKKNIDNVRKLIKSVHTFARKTKRERSTYLQKSTTFSMKDTLGKPNDQWSPVYF